MKSYLKALVLGTGILAANLALANAADDAKWIAECEKDNEGDKNGPDKIKRYCTCMNNKMSDDETLSISAWEKTAPGQRAEKECEREVGWVN